jgi:Tol biopolymer transport system component
MKKTYRILSFLLAVLMILSTAMIIVNAADGKTRDGLEFSSRQAQVIGKLYEKTPYYVLVRQRQLGASHYAYTEALAEDYGRDNQEPEGREAVFNPGSEMVLVTIIDNGDGTYKTVEEVLLESQKGVIRDPDVSTDGERILFSWKKASNDDYHIYEMTLATREIKQLTFGSGAADIEGN